jgi:hypothetical protein
VCLARLLPWTDPGFRPMFAQTSFGGLTGKGANHMAGTSAFSARLPPPILNPHLRQSGPTTVFLQFDFGARATLLTWPHSARGFFPVLSSCALLRGWQPTQALFSIHHFFSPAPDMMHSACALCCVLPLLVPFPCRAVRMGPLPPLAPLPVPSWRCLSPAVSLCPLCLPSKVGPADRSVRQARRSGTAQIIQSG